MSAVKAAVLCRWNFLHSTPSPSDWQKMLHKKTCSSFALCGVLLCFCFFFFNLEDEAVFRQKQIHLCKSLSKCYPTHFRCWKTQVKNHWGMECLTIKTVQMYATQTPVKYIRGWKRASFIAVLMKIQTISKHIPSAWLPFLCSEQCSILLSTTAPHIIHPDTKQKEEMCTDSNHCWIS